ncbi:MAG: thiamine pyrophosphate-dependent enzyme, partial [Pseudomonadota bacterium]
IFVIENNGYGEHTGADYAVGCESIADRSAAFGMPAETVDGANFFDVRDAMARALERARNGGGPSTVVTECPRFLGHFIGDPQPYRTEAELLEARKRDALEHFCERVIEANLLSANELREIEADVAQEVQAAVEAGLAAPMPDIADLETNVYASPY